MSSPSPLEQTSRAKRLFLIVMETAGVTAGVDAEVEHVAAAAEQAVGDGLVVHAAAAAALTEYHRCLFGGVQQRVVVRDDRVVIEPPVLGVRGTGFLCVRSAVGDHVAVFEDPVLVQALRAVFQADIGCDRSRVAVVVAQRFFHGFAGRVPATDRGFGDREVARGFGQRERGAGSRFFAVVDHAVVPECDPARGYRHASRDVRVFDRFRFRDLFDPELFGSAEQFETPVSPGPG